MPTELNKIRVAIAHDWLNGLRGGEQVLDAILEIFPQAELFTLFYTPGKLNPRIENRPIHTSFLNHLPGASKYYRHLLPLFPLAIERFNLNKFDLVISTSHCVAKGIIPGPNALHISYCFTPMRYAWDRYSDYFGNSTLEPLIYPFMHYLRLWDTASSQRVDHFIADSTWVQTRIEKYYRREAAVILPFANLDRFEIGTGNRDYYLMVSAFAPYKKMDLGIRACEKLGRRLKIVGGGQTESLLRSIAGPNTEFLGKLPDKDLAKVYAGAKALLFPGEEDFGIVPLEAMACGTPVIALGKGGVLDTVLPGKTGLFFDEPEVDSLTKAVLDFEKRSFSVQACRQQAEKFSRPFFQKEFLEFVEEKWPLHKGQRRTPLSENIRPNERLYPLDN